VCSALCACAGLGLRPRPLDRLDEAARAVLDLLKALLGSLISSLHTRHELVLENLALRQQIAVLRRSVMRPRLSNADRGFWVLMRRCWANWDKVLVVVQPATVIKWHRAGFRKYWAWRSRPKGGRPAIDPLKLGIRVSGATVSKTMPRRRKPPSQTWRWFLEHHVIEQHLRRLLRRYLDDYYHPCRTHLSLGKDLPARREIEWPEMGEVIELPVVGGLHHRYTRRAA
jgi:hypothetical protein